MLKNFNAELFLEKHWQKSACLIKNAFEVMPDYISAEELAGLSLEEDVESRIVSNFDNHWQLQQGPFEPSIFEDLPKSHWTLLVQTLDYWLPEINQLVKEFSFIPRWRFDDVMVSYATDGGGVGPHYDNYDVFLIQTQGTRRWQVGETGVLPENADVIDGLKHLKPFKPIIDVIMQPGDMLYVPPNTAHWGQSVGESMGYSVGYRAPQTRDILALLANHFDCSKDNTFFNDDYRKTTNPSNQIEPELIKWAQDEIIKIANNQSLIVSLLSKSLSHSKLDCIETTPPKQPVDLADIKSVQLIDGINANWYLNNDSIKLNVEGETYQVDVNQEALVKTLLKGESIDVQGLQATNQIFDFSETLATFINMGYLLVEK